MNLYEILGILLIHWFADFVMQTDKQAKGKSKNWSDLLDHTIVYSLIWGVIGLFFCCPYFGKEYEMFKADVFTLFLFITFICHTITDYFTSRLNSKLWAAGKTHNFFVSIGFDQWLHYAQLFITYWYLLK